MDTISWQGGANLHPDENLLPGANSNLHLGANCAHEHGFVES